ncbi:MAG: hypothetical protein P8046_14850, partial [Anaerolineales bacterium]
MTDSSKLLREGRKEELWNKHCGYISLSIEEFMEIQNRLLMEQLNLMGASKIGREIMGDSIPKNVEEFKQV